MARRVIESRADSIDVLVGHKLRALRKARGLSQSALGEAMGITFQQVQKYEWGTNRISVSMLAHAARALDANLVELLPQETGYDAPVDGIAELLRTLIHLRGAEELIQAYAKIRSPRLRRALLHFVRALTKPANDKSPA